MPTAEWVGRLQRRSVHSIRHKAQELGIKFGQELGVIPSVSRSLPELFQDRAAEYSRKADHYEAKRNLRVKIDEPGVYGLMLFGDAHADDPGCDIEHLAYCMDLAKSTPGLYSINLGDLTNNWIGKLSRLHGFQGTTEDEAVELLDWMVSEVPWILMILGNHDKWTRDAESACKKHGVRYASHGAFLTIESERGEICCDVRHTHPGNSQYNGSHGQLKRSYRGSRADIVAGAHIHMSAYTHVKNGVTGQLSHCLRLGAFKREDDHADRLGYDDECISPAVIAICCPDSEHKVLIDHDIDRGLRILKFLRAA